MTDPEDHDHRTIASSAEEALRVSEDRLRLIMAAGRFGIWEWDISTGRVSWSPEIFQILEADPRELTGTVDELDQLFHPDDRKRFQSHVDRALRGEGDFEAELRVVRPRGGIGWVMNRGTVVRGADGAPLRLVGIIADVTERKQATEILHESEQRFRNMADHSPVMIWITDHDGSCVYLNRRWYELTGQGENEGLGYGWLNALHPDDRERAEESFLRAVEHHEDFRLDYRLRRRDGVYRWCIDSATPRLGEDGAYLGYIGSVIDITERKAIEDALREADQRKNSFLAMLSHELRNPLGPIRNAVHFLRLSGPPEPALARAFDMIDRQVVHMSRLVDELLDVSRIARGRIVLRKDRCDLCRIVRETAEDYRNTLEADGLTFEIQTPSEPLWTCGDETRLAQVVSNILHNAGKFTESGGRVTVSLADSGDGAAVLRVLDTGIGVAPAMLGRLFEPFSHEDRSQDRSRGGLGLGLALVKGLAELHGGTVSAASEGLGRGTEIAVRLPLDPGACEDREESE
jgi:PAS domain S-box-containing protein